MQRLFQAIFPVFWCSRRSLFDLLSPDNLHPCLKMAVFFEFLSLRSKPLKLFSSVRSTVALQQRARRVPGFPPHRAKITRVGDSGPALIPSIRVISFTLRMAVYHPASSSWIQQLL
jgi:hypothetical protein